MILRFELLEIGLFFLLVVLFVDILFMGVGFVSTSGGITMHLVHILIFKL